MTFAARFIGWVKSLFQVQRGLRLRAAASPSIRRTFPTAGDQRTWSLAIMCKRGAIGVGQDILRIGNSGGSLIYFGSDDKLHLTLSTGSAETRVTSAVFRDPNAWMFFLIVLDTTQAVAADRVKIYTSAGQITSFSTSNDPGLNTQFAINSAAEHVLFQSYDTIGFFDGYCAEVSFVNAQALTQTSFGDRDSTGNWKVKPYAGVYGTNGFRLDFSDATSLATLMLDRSGNGNNWIATNISLAAGVTYDSVLDVPLGAGGGERGNYATLNPLRKDNTALVVDNGNLRWTANSVGSQWTFGTQALTVKTYWEVVDQTAAIGTYGNLYMGIASGSFPTNGAVTAAGLIAVRDAGDFYRNGTTNPAGTGSPYSTGATNDVWMFAYDPATYSFWIGRNGTWFNSGNPASGTGAISTVNLGGDVFPACGAYQGGDGPASVNFGQRPFSYTPPAGFKALHTGNLPEPAILNPREHFDTLLWQGGASASQDLSGLNFEPGLVWVKGRSGTYNHALFDAVRGANAGLYSNLTSTEGVWSGQAFLPTGFRVDRTFSGETNTNGANYVGWFWKAGGAPVANNNGSVASQTSVNALAGFSVVSYTGDLTTTGTRTIGHGLSIAPKVVISKSRNTNGADAGSWMLQHASLGTDDFLYLNSSNSVADAVSSGGGTLPKPTSTVFSSTWNSGGCVSGNNYIAYCFAEIAGYSKFGIFIGNGNADGPFVDCGFEPAIVIGKRVDGVTNWFVVDNARSPSNPGDRWLLPNGTHVEQAQVVCDFTATGFKMRSSLVEFNGSGAQYIFMAFAKTPMKYALAR